MNKTQFILRISILAVISHPVVIAYLSPYMIFVVGIDFDQWMVWAIGGMPLSIGLNAILAFFFPIVTKPVDKIVNKILKEKES